MSRWTRSALTSFRIAALSYNIVVSSAVPRPWHLWRVSLGLKQVGKKAFGQCRPAGLQGDGIDETSSDGGDGHGGRVRPAQRGAVCRTYPRRTRPALLGGPLRAAGERTRRQPCHGARGERHGGRRPPDRKP